MVLWWKLHVMAEETVWWKWHR